MKSKKIALLALALVLALGALGVGYAAWTDTIDIDGTVNTGSLDLNVVGYSGTWIYKDLDDDSLVLYNWELSEQQMTDWNKILVAYAKAEEGAAGENTVLVTFDNAFPCQTLVADILVKYEGTIPAKVDAEITGADPPDCVLAQYAQVHFYWSDANHTQGTEIFDVVQMHEGDYVLAVMSLHLPQDNTLMNLDCSFTAQINCIQWNEYGY